LCEPLNCDCCLGCVFGRRQLRRRYRKIYEDYKPKLAYWKVVLIARKFAFSLIVVMLDSDIEAQVRVERICQCTVPRSWHAEGIWCSRSGAAVVPSRDLPTNHRSGVVACERASQHDAPEHSFPSPPLPTLFGLGCNSQCRYLHSTPPSSTHSLAPPNPTQASCSIALLVASYILQQRYAPFVSTESIAESLRLTPADIERRLQGRQALSVQPASGPRARGTSRATRDGGPGPVPSTRLRGASRAARDHGTPPPSVPALVVDGRDAPILSSTVDDHGEVGEGPVRPLVTGARVGGGPSRAGLRRRSIAVAKAGVGALVTRVLRLVTYKVRVP
jgi:hypothetical protein